MFSLIPAPHDFTGPTLLSFYQIWCLLDSVLHDLLVSRLPGGEISGFNGEIPQICSSWTRPLLTPYFLRNRKEILTVTHRAFFLQLSLDLPPFILVVFWGYAKNLVDSSLFCSQPVKGEFKSHLVERQSSASGPGGTWPLTG